MVFAEFAKNNISFSFNTDNKIDVTAREMCPPAVRTINITFTRKSKTYARRSKTYIPTRKGFTYSFQCGVIEY